MPRKAAKQPTPKLDKYLLYEHSVQSPDAHVDWFYLVYRQLRKKKPHVLREDFCGTFHVCAEWIKRDPLNLAIGIDLDPEPLIYGMKTHGQQLSLDQKARLTLLKQNVKSVTRPKADMIVASNFSFCVFMKRQELVEYLRCCRLSLAEKGMLVMELAGGPGMIEKMHEKKVVREKGLPPFTYVWDQQSFDPITREGRYAIHFEFRKGKKRRAIEDAFTYHWRLWTIPELRDAMADAGFKNSCVYWESSHSGKGTGEFIRSEHGDNAHAWVAYVIGLG